MNHKDIARKHARDNGRDALRIMAQADLLYRDSRNFLIDYPTYNAMVAGAYALDDKAIERFKLAYRFARLATKGD